MNHKINRMTLVEQVAVHIEELIKEGHWPVGTRIPPEMKLMEKFDVSRNTLREAIRALVHAGLLETKQGSGTIVCSANSLDAALKRHVKKTALLETLDVRLALEKKAAQLAAEHRTEADIKQLELLIDRCRKAADKNDLNEFITADIQFHKAVVQASNNQLLVDLYEPLTDIIYSFIQDLMEMEVPSMFTEALHLELFDAIRTQNKTAATQYVENYMKVIRENVVTIMEEQHEQTT